MLNRLLSLAIILSFICGCYTIGQYTLNDLSAAAAKGDTVAIQTLIKQGNNVNDKGKNSPYATALHWAARNGQIEAAKLLIKAGANINSRDSFEQTPLFYAVDGNSANSIEMVKLLLDNRADVNCRDQKEKTPLCYAVQKRRPDLDVAKLLISKGADVNTLSNERYPIPLLHWALSFGQDETTQMLLDAGASINLIDSQSRTALIHAINAGKIDRAKMFIDKGVDTEVLDGLGWRAINYARQTGDADLIKLILSKKSGKRLTDKDDPDFNYRDSRLVSFKQATPEIKIRSSKKITLAVHDQRQYIVSAEKAPLYLGYFNPSSTWPYELSSSDKKPLADVVGDLIVKGFAESNTSINQVIVTFDQKKESVLGKTKQSQADRIIVLTLNEWIIDNIYWTGEIGFSYDISVDVFDGTGKSLLSKPFKGRDKIEGWAGMQHTLVKVFAAESAQRRLTDLFSKPEIKAALR